jgi:hypothetical protein
MNIMNQQKVIEEGGVNLSQCQAAGGVFADSVCHGG